MIAPISIALSESLRSLHWGWQLVFVLGVVTLMLAFVGIAIRPVRIWFHGRIGSTSVGKAQTIAESTDQATSWLEDVAQQDLDNLAQRIKVEVRRLEFGGLNRREPFFQLLVNVTNTTVFEIRLKSCDGHIQVSSGPLSLSPLVQEPPLPAHLAHGQNKKITLHQAVTKETAEWLTEQASTKNPVTFVCILCRLVFDVVTIGYDREIPIVLKDDGLPCLPEGTYEVPFRG